MLELSYSNSTKRRFIIVSMRDKLKELMGKKISYNAGTGHIWPFGSGKFYERIIEVGDDYFVTNCVWTTENREDYPTIYAISEVKRIEGGPYSK